MIPGVTVIGMTASDVDLMDTNAFVKRRAANDHRGKRLRRMSTAIVACIPDSEIMLIASNPTVTVFTSVASGEALPLAGLPLWTFVLGGDQFGDSDVVA
jgi:hypothetical protein